MKNALTKAKRIPLDLLKIDMAIAELTQELSQLKRQESRDMLRADMAIAADPLLKNDQQRKARKFELTDNPEREEAIARLSYEIEKLNAQRDYHRRALRLLEIEAQQEPRAEISLPRF